VMQPNISMLEPCILLVTVCHSKGGMWIESIEIIPKKF
jgi:hypothetical protein